MPRIADLAAVAHILENEHGWDFARIIERLKTPYGVTALVGLWHLTANKDGPGTAVGDAGSSAMLLVVDADELPDPLPSGWTIVGRTAPAVTVLVFTHSRIDWSELELCVQPAGEATSRCDKTATRVDENGRVYMPNMPPPGGVWRGTITASVTAVPGLSEEIFMPRMFFMCGGRVVSRGSDAVQVDPDGRRAALAAVEHSPSPATLRLEWQVGSPECNVMTFDGLIPFFVDGDAASVRLIEAILRKREKPQ